MKSCDYTLTDASDERLLAEAETIADARFAARTMHEEGEPLPILIHCHDGAGDRVVERLVEGPRGAMIATSSLSRSLS